jgi:hypothetical protein
MNSTSSDTQEPGLAILARLIARRVKKSHLFHPKQRDEHSPAHITSKPISDRVTECAAK